jgi:hypothetical protein
MYVVFESGACSVFQLAVDVGGDQFRVARKILNL